MPQNVGIVSLDATLDFRKATAAYNRFQRTINQKGKRDNLFSGISEDAKQFESSLGKATNRVVAFAAAAALFQGLSRATSAFAQSIIEVDQSLAKINVNLGQSSAGLKKFGADLFNIARQTGQTFEVAASAAEELARQGLSAEETTKRLKDALILSRIAGLDSASAVETLTAAINSFNQEALTSTEVVNKFAAVDTKFAVSSKDLAEAVSRVGSTAQSAGVGINELIGLVTSLQQTTARGGATIGNGLKTIFTRIQAAPETVAALQSVGVAIKNTDGSLRDAISILRDYGAARQKVGEVERASLDRTVAGTFQINILKAALGDLGKQYSVYNSALSTSANATDEAIRKNEQLNQTLASLINSTATSIKQLFASIGDQSLGPAFKQLFKFVEEARAFFSGESGDELGRSLGSGVLKGISNVLSGPALVALTVILGQAFKKVIVTLASEAKTLLSINGIVGTRAAIQRQINNLLAQANAEEAAQIAGARTLIAQKQALLAIQERLNQEAALGTTLQNSFIVPGRLGIGSRIGGGLGRKSFPTFADPLASAVAREKAAGVPASQIYVDRDPRVANFANPQGLLIANRRDEPLGGYQGVNRVIAEGGNPKTAGMTPNFAPLKSQKDLVLERMGLKKTYEGAALTSVQIAMANTKGVTTAAKQLEKTIGSLDNAFAPLVQSAKIADSVRRAMTGNLFGSSPEEVRRPSTGNPYRISRGTALPPPTNIPNVIPQSRRGFKNIAFESFEGGGDDLINRQVQYDMNNPQSFGAYDESGAYSSPIGPSYKDFRRQQLTKQMQRRRNIATIAARKKEAFGNRSLGYAFGLPFLGGFIEPGANGLGVDTRGGTTGGRATGALSGAFTGAGLGALTRTPQGIAGGALIGALIGGLSKLNKSTEDLIATTEEQTAKNQQTVDAAGSTLQVLEELKEARASNESPTLIKRLETKLTANSASISDPGLRAALSSGDLTKFSEAIEKFSVLANQSAAGGRAATGISTLSPNSFIGGNFSKGARSSISTDLAASIGTNKVNVDTKRLFEIAFGKTATSGAINDVKGVLDQLSQFSPALKDVTINATNVSGVADILIATFQKVTANGKSVAEALNKIAQPQGLRPGAFANPGNNDSLRSAAFTGRNPFLFTQNQRGKSQFGFYQNLIESGALDQKILEGGADDSPYKKSEALNSSDNALRAALSYVQNARPGGGEYTDSRGEPNAKVIAAVLRTLSKNKGQEGEQAKVLLGITEQAQQTRVNAGIKRLPVVDGGLAEGVRYSTYAPGAPRGFNGYDSSQQASDKARAQKYFSDHVNNSRSGFTVTQTPPFNKNAPAAGRNGSIDEQAVLGADKTLAVNVNIDGALNLIANGMDPGLVALINTKVNQAVIDATSEYFQDVQPQLDAVKAQLASINGKPIPPAPKQVPLTNKTAGQ